MDPSTAGTTNSSTSTSTSTKTAWHTNGQPSLLHNGQDARHPPDLKANLSLHALTSQPVATPLPRPNNARARTSSSTHTHSPSISSGSITGSLPARKSRHSEPGTSDIHAELLNFAAHPASPRSAALPRGRCYSSAAVDTLWSEATVVPVAEAQQPPLVNFGDVDDDDDPDTPHPRPTASTEPFTGSLLSEPPLAARPSPSGTSSRRPSGNSVASSTTSVRGLFKASRANSTSDSISRLRSASLMSSSKAPNPPQAQSEAGLSNVTVTTSSGAQAGQVAAGAHNLTTRDPHAQPLDLMRRNQRFDNVNTSTGPNANANTNGGAGNSSNTRTQPDRSRSRVKRRFSGSTANSSHSPSSDRGPPHREKEEGQWPPC
jgi:inositol-hexakisphosphate/diphosphoinositol-pentakisphosphate 1-kinase